MNYLLHLFVASLVLWTLYACIKQYDNQDYQYAKLAKALKQKLRGRYGSGSLTAQETAFLEIYNINPSTTQPNLVAAYHRVMQSRVSNQ